MQPLALALKLVSQQVTTVTALSAKLEWKINQFEKLMKFFKSDQNLRSRQFGSPQAQEVTWELQVYPNGMRKDDTGYVSVFLRQVGYEVGPIMTDFEIYALDANLQRDVISGDRADFTSQHGLGQFQVANKQIKAHRGILSVHSAVFRSMFQNEMIEAKNGIVDIADARYEAVRAMVEYMYTGSFVSAEQHAEAVLAISDRYAVLPLKEQCERFIAHSISHENIISTVISADTYSANILKQACIRFLVAHPKSVRRYSEWRALLKERQELATELALAVLANGGESPPDDEGNNTPLRKPSRKRISRPRLFSCACKTHSYRWKRA